MEKETVKVLLIEDDPAYADLIQDYLMQGGSPFVHFAVEVVFNFQDGLNAITEHPPDVVLSDLLLPGCQGIEAFQQLHQKNPDLPVVLLTCVDDEALAREAVRQGAQDYLVKTRVNGGVISRVLLYTIERKRYEERLRRSQKMEAIGRLASGLSHDLRNLVTAILGYADVVLEKELKDPELREGILEIKKAGEKANDLTRQLLAFGRQSVAEPKVCDINVLIKEMSGMLARMMGEDIQLMTVLSKGPSNVKIDPAYAEVVVMNLAANARQAMPKGGKLVLQVDNLDFQSPHYERGEPIPSGPFVLLTVSDTGCGIDGESQKHIFEPFFTSPPRSEGTGLELATVHEIVKQNGGHIFVYSEPAKGATFQIYLPRVEEEAEALGRAPEEETQAAGGNETILLVEDDEAIRHLVRSVLVKNGYRVLEASQGNEALKAASAYSEVIHLVLTDGVMPEMSGGKLIEQIRQKRPGIKVVIMSGYSMDRSLCAELNETTGFLQKPFSTQELLRKIRQALDVPVKT